MNRYLPIVIVAVLLVVDGYVHGLWTNRWQTTSKDLELASARLQLVPMIVGDWQGESMKPLSEREVEQAGFAGYVNRRFKNYQTGSVISILLACGRSGPLSVHTPDICYRGAGYEPTGINVKHSEKNDDITAEMWKAHFGKSDLSSSVKLRVLWCWSTGKSWKAPDNPRITFAGAPALYKLYVIQEFNGDDQQASKTCSEFLSQLLPELNRILLPKS